MFFFWIRWVNKVFLCFHFDMVGDLPKLSIDFGLPEHQKLSIVWILQMDPLQQNRSNFGDFPSLSLNGDLLRGIRNSLGSGHQKLSIVWVLQMDPRSNGSMFKNTFKIRRFPFLNGDLLRRASETVWVIQMDPRLKTSSEPFKFRSLSSNGAGHQKLSMNKGYIIYSVSR
jgi:hypothetical protein